MSDPATPAPFKKSVAREYLESIVVAVILALFIRTFVVQAFKIPTGSMSARSRLGVSAGQLDRHEPPASPAGPLCPSACAILLAGARSPPAAHEG